MLISTRLSAANEWLNQHQDTTAYRDFSPSDHIIRQLCQRFRLRPGELLRYHETHGTTPADLIQQIADDMGVPADVLENTN